MRKSDVIKKTAEYVRKTLEGEGSGHDWWHIYRVWKMAVNIAKKEQVDLYLVELGALLHDIADWKFNNGDLEAGAKVSEKWLKSLDVDRETCEKVCEIVRHVSFKGAGEISKMKSMEGKVVQDADRLDALGAIGIARTFAYGGSKGRAMYDPDKSPEKHENFEQYKNSQGHTINHFYEKLLLLKDLLNTRCAKKIALKRHRFMEKYLEQFYKEWDGRI